MQSKKNDAAQISGCDLTNIDNRQYCTFGQMGISSTPFDVYLQNDALSAEIMSFVMRGEKYPRLGNMQAELTPTLTGDGADAAFATKLGLGYGNKFYLPEIRGCGVYTLSLMGAVNMAGNQLQPEQINVGIKLISPRRETGECQYKIQNASNFLPKDRGLPNYSSSQQTLLGVVESAADLSTQGEKLAETIFGSKGRYASNTSTNRLSLNIGNQEDSIVELTLDPSTETAQTKNIIANVRKTPGAVQDAAVVEVGKIITQLGKGVEGCITRDERTWKITSAKDVGTFQFQGCALTNTKEGGLAVRNSQACCVLETKSEIKSGVSYALQPNTKQGLIPGLAELDLYEAVEPLDPKKPVPGNIINYGATYELQFNSQTQRFQKNILLCGTTNPQLQQQANKAIVDATATRVNDSKKAGPIKLEIRVCTQTPEEALAGAIKKGDGVYYSTVDWSDSAARKTLLQVIENIDKDKKVGPAFFSYQDKGVYANTSPQYQDAFQVQQAKALGAYTTACLLACGMCSIATGFATGGVGGLAGFAMDCGLGCAIGAGVGAIEVYKDEIQNAPIVGPAAGAVGVPFAFARDVETEVFSASPENVPVHVAATTTEVVTLLRSQRNYSKVPFKEAEKPAKKVVEFATKKVELDNAIKQFGEIPKDLDQKASALRRAYTNKLNPARGGGKAAEEAYVAASNAFDNAVSQARSNLPAAEAQIDSLIKEITDGPRPNDFRATVADLQNLKPRATQLRVDISGKIDTAANAAVNPRARIPTINEARFTTESGAMRSTLTTSMDNATSIGKSVAKKVKPTPGSGRVAKIAKGLRVFVCGTTGAIAGVAAYQKIITSEIENKISIEAENKNVTDPSTEELVFEKGQTYRFTVSTDPNNKTGKKVKIGIVSPQEKIPADKWVDDCGQQGATTASAPNSNNQTNPANPNAPVGETLTATTPTAPAAPPATAPNPAPTPAPAPSTAPVGSTR